MEDLGTRKLLLIGSPSAALKDKSVGDCPWLVPALDYLRKSTEVPAWWRRLLRDLGASTPACGLFSFTKDRTVEQISKIVKNGIETHKDFEMVATVCPVLYGIMRKDSSDECMNVLRPIFIHLMSKTLPALSIQPHDRTPSADIVDDGGFPQLTLKYQRGLFTKDSKEKSKSPIDQVCMKRSAKHKALTPGIFTVSCPHGKFEVVDSYPVIDDVLEFSRASCSRNW